MLQSSHHTLAIYTAFCAMSPAEGKVLPYHPWTLGGGVGYHENGFGSRCPGGLAMPCSEKTDDFNI